MSTTTVYGIANCDTVKKARAWLAANGVAHAFHDFKKLGVPPGELAKWLEAAGHERLVNKAGTTFRGLSEAEKALAGSAEGAFTLLQQHASVIKRPVVRWASGALTVGFDVARFAQQLK